MKNRTAITLTAITGLLTIGTAAEAATFTYTLTNPPVTGGIQTQNITSSPAGFPGTITAFKDLTPVTNGTLSIDVNGAGVLGNPPISTLGAGNVGTSATQQEVLRLAVPNTGIYQHGYKIKSVTYANVLATPTAAREFGITAGSVTSNFTVPGTNATVTVTPTKFLGGNSFDFFVVNTDGRFRIQSVELETIPEPLTILGTGFAAAALPALKKANKKAKK